MLHFLLQNTKSISTTFVLAVVNSVFSFYSTSSKQNCTVYKCFQIIDKTVLAYLLKVAKRKLKNRSRKLKVNRYIGGGTQHDFLKVFSIRSTWRLECLYTIYGTLVGTIYIYTDAEFMLIRMNT